MSAKKAVLKVPTLGRKTTYMQLTGFQIPACQNTSPVFLFGVHDIPLQAVTCHFFVEAFFIISHVRARLVRGNI